ncbi:hypothetical protein DKX38_025853 [Salix brachista]|uniref:S-locus receptor kinase C-terminal domain-containing protein n=1 Tax=Salix brachista TaxID=2182728 RepID=A0A5N5JTV1_9ROSI|nr:hypothetical protein DKX38_025853 [Salix brachista]
MNKTIDDSSSSSEVERCIQVGLLCVQQRPEDRPSMSTVVVMLSSEISLPHPKQPGPHKRIYWAQGSNSYIDGLQMRASYGFWKKKTMDWPSLQLLPHSSQGLEIKDGKTREKKSMA